MYSVACVLLDKTTLKYLYTLIDLNVASTTISFSMSIFSQFVSSPYFPLAAIVVYRSVAASENCRYFPQYFVFCTSLSGGCFQLDFPSMSGVFLLLWLLLFAVQAYYAAKSRLPPLLVVLCIIAVIVRNTNTLTHWKVLS